MLRSHGINKKSYSTSDNKNGWYNEMQLLGFNYRMSDINCALGISQLNRADLNLKRRRLIAKKYIESFKNTSILTPFVNCDEHAFHLFVILVDKRKELYNHLKSFNINTQVHYVPVHKMPYYEKKYGRQVFTISEKFYSKCLSLPIYPSLSNEEQEYVIEKVISFYK